MTNEAATGFEPKYSLNEVVRLGDGSITCRIEEIIFSRGMSSPLYLVEWWVNGSPQSCRVHESDLSPREDFVAKIKF